jgi:hypothetical protein
MWASVVAVLGTLLGGLTAGVTQGRVARSARRETRADGHRADAVAAVTALVSALADHRRVMWLLEDRRLTGAARNALDEALLASHETRSAITAPLAMVCILAPALAESARQAANAAYAMRNAPNLDELETFRAAAVIACDDLVDQAAIEFADLAARS